MPKKASAKRATNKGKSRLRDLPAKRSNKVKGGARRTGGMGAPSISGAWIS
jgi:hypothetical protein